MTFVSSFAYSETASRSILALVRPMRDGWMDGKIQFSGFIIWITHGKINTFEYSLAAGAFLGLAEADVLMKATAT